jgi:hypothetical protein
MTETPKFALLLVGAITLLTSCNREAPPKGRAPTEHQILATCKLETLREPRSADAQGDVENFFDACMASKGYERVDIAMCYPPNNPAYYYVSGKFDLGARGIDDCYKAVSD